MSHSTTRGVWPNRCESPPGNSPKTRFEPPPKSMNSQFFAVFPYVRRTCGAITCRVEADIADFCKSSYSDSSSCACSVSLESDFENLNNSYLDSSSLRDLKSEKLAGTRIIDYFGIDANIVLAILATT